MAYTKAWWRLQIDRCLSEWAQNKWALLGWLAMQAATSTVEPVEVTRDLPPADISGLCGGGLCGKGTVSGSVGALMYLFSSVGFEACRAFCAWAWA